MLCKFWFAFPVSGTSEGRDFKTDTQVHRCKLRPTCDNQTTPKLAWSWSCDSFLLRDATPARYMLWPYVRPSVGLSATSRCFITIAKHNIMKTTPYDKLGTLVSVVEDLLKLPSSGITRNVGAKYAWGRKI